MAYLGAAQDRHEKDIHAFHTPHVACRRAVQTASVVVVFPGQLQEYCKEHSSSAAKSAHAAVAGEDEEEISNLEHPNAAGDESG